MRVCFAAAEMEPLAKVGGLADVAGSLPPALRALGIDIRVFTPLHGNLRNRLSEFKKCASVKIITTRGKQVVTAYETCVAGVTVYLVDGSPIKAAPSVYSTDRTVDGRKFIAFSRSILPLCRKILWVPDIIHANDWHTAITLVDAATDKPLRSSPQPTRTVLTIHNLPFMGAGIDEVLDEYNVPPLADPSLPVWSRKIPLPMGISATHRCIAVSPTYAKEIQTPEYGCGLQEYLSANHRKLSGIINGIDIQTWDPRSDKTLVANFSTENPGDRSINKRALQNELGLPPDHSVPLFCFIGRMDQQKGVELIPPALQTIITKPWQCVFLGTGDPTLEEAIRLFEAANPERVRACIAFNPILASKLYASADMILIPSRYEPCGLVQMIAMRYGCVPVARATGGLRDSIQDIDASRTGFLYQKDNSAHLADTLVRALSFFENQQQWQNILLRAMLQDFSWSRSAHDYHSVYRSLLGETI